MAPRSWLRLGAALFLLLSIAALPRLLSAQAPGMESRDGALVAIRGEAADRPSRVEAPGGRSPISIQSATIAVNYTGFSPAAQAAFQHAVDIWEGQISSPVPIVIDASWEPLGAGQLGGAGPRQIFRNFPNAPQANTWYPSALANKLAGSDLSPANVDIVAQFSSAVTNWYLGTDGNTPAGKYDFVSVVLHEIGHGLGFTSTFSVSGGQGSWGEGTAFPIAFDRFVVNGSGQALLNAALFPSPSSALAAQLTGDSAFFSGSNAMAAAGGARPKLYAPASWLEGSSLSHLDENTYGPGDPNSLMTPFIAGAESIHNPGPIARGILQDIGWSLEATTPTSTATPSRTATGGAGAPTASATGTTNGGATATARPGATQTVAVPPSGGSTRAYLSLVSRSAEGLAVGATSTAGIVPTQGATPTRTATRSATPAATSTRTNTPTPSRTATRSPTASATGTQGATATRTATPSATRTPSPTGEGTR